MRYKRQLIIVVVVIIGDARYHKATGQARDIRNLCYHKKETASKQQ